MPEAHWSTRQAARFEILREHPFKAAGWRELAKTLKKHFPDESRAKQAVDRILAEMEECPTPATIKRYAEAMGLLQPAAERLADTASRQDCKECDNTGRRRILKQQMVQAASGPKAIEIPFLGYCSCPLGQQMAGKRTVEPDQKGVQGVLV